MNRNFSCRATSLLVVCFFVLLTPCTAFAQSLKPASPELVKIVMQDTHHSVGKTLPDGILVVDSHDHEVDLRKALKSLHGPVVLAVVTTTNCPPCDKLVDYAKKNADHKGT